MNYNVFTENLKIYDVLYQCYKGTEITNMKTIYMSSIISVSSEQVESINEAQNVRLPWYIGLALLLLSPFIGPALSLKQSNRCWQLLKHLRALMGHCTCLLVQKS